MKKYTILGIIAALGLAASMFGGWAKLTHQSYADNAMTIGKIMQVVGLVALTLMLILWLKKKN